MAQERFWQWLDDDSTFRLNWRDLLILPYGLYRGFDNESPKSGWNLILGHSLSEGKVDLNLNTSNKMGVWKTKQGVVITEDTSISLTVDPSHATLKRIDLIVAEHQYIQTQGGTTAIYKVIKGVPGTNPTVPSIMDPSKQVVLGELFIPNGAADISECTYTKSGIPDFNGDSTIMHTDKVQVSTALKVFNVQMGMVVITELDLSSHKIITSTPSNIYVVANINALTYTPYELIKGFTHEVSTDLGQEITIFTEHSLRLEDTFTSGTGNLVIPEGTRYIEPHTTFKMIKVGYYGGATCWTVIGGDAVKGGNNKFRGNQIFDKSTTPSIASNKLSFGTKGANFYELAAITGTPELRWIQSQNVQSKTPVKTNEAGGIFYLKINSSILIKNNITSGLPADSKPIIFPTGLDYTFGADTFIMLLEDSNAYRVLSVWNSDYSVLKLKAMKLNDLNDVTLTSETEGDILVKGPGTTDWYNVNADTFIQNLQLDMQKRFGLSYTDELVAFKVGTLTMMGALPTLVGISGGYALNLDKNVTKYYVGNGVWSSFLLPGGGGNIIALPDYPQGTQLFVAIDYATSLSINLSSTPGTGWVGIRHNSRTGTHNFSNTMLKFTCVSYPAPTFGVLKYWQLEEIKDYDTAISNINSDINQIDTDIANILTQINQSGGILSRITTLESNRARADASNITPSVWVNKLNVREIIANFWINIGDIVGGQTVGTWKSCGGTNISGCQVIYNTASDTAYRVDFSPAMPTSMYVVYFSIKSFGSSGDLDNDLAFITVRNQSVSSFEFWVREVSANTQNVQIIGHVIKEYK